MKQLILFSAFIAGLFVFSTTASAQRMLPDTEVLTLEGERVKLSDHGSNGKITVISFWATWCSPCKKELDAIMETYDTWGEKYNAELVAISVDNARSMAKVGPMVASKGWDYQIYLDPNDDLKKVLNFGAVPQTYIVDHRGYIVYDHTGYVPGDEYELEEKLEELSRQ